VPQQAQPAPAPPSLRENVEEATSAVASLTRRTAGETVEQGRLLLPAVSLPAPEQAALAEPLEPPVESLRQAGQGVTTSLAPVTTSARRAVDLFLRDIPPMAERN
jgi:hypothetical protein